MLTKTWDESQHPREPAGSPEGGQFAGGGGGGSGGGASASGESKLPHAEHVAGIIKDVMRKVDYTGSYMVIPGEGPHFEVAGQHYKTAGTANLKTGLITIYTGAFPATTSVEADRDDDIAGVVAHEIEHEKFQRAKEAHDREFDALMVKYPAGAFDIMRADGLLKPPYDKEFPNYQDYEKYFHLPDTVELRQGDGVSDYSFNWWKAQQGNEATKEQATHETLAEMAKGKYLTGSFPGHIGPSLIRFRPTVDGEPAPKPSPQETKRLIQMWRDLYDAVDRINERIKVK